MKKLLAIIILGLLMAGCVATTSELYTKVKTDNKVIGMPASNFMVAKILKKLFRKNDWKIVIVDMGTVKTTGSATDKVNLESEYKSKTSYIVSLRQGYSDYCGIKNEKVWFALTIIDSKTGEEAFVAEGDDCIKTISKDLEVQLSPFWN